MVVYTGERKLYNRHGISAFGTARASILRGSSNWSNTVAASSTSGGGGNVALSTK